MADSKIDHGGFAFPTAEIKMADGQVLDAGSDGMSLRDWFAGQAPVTFEMACDSIKISTVSMRLHCEEEAADLWAAMAKLRYVYADAMLAARKVGV